MVIKSCSLKNICKIMQRIERRSSRRSSSIKLAPEITTAEAEINKLYKNEAFMQEFTDPSHPGHEAAFKRMERLALLASGGDDVITTLIKNL